MLESPRMARIGACDPNVIITAGQVGRKERFWIGCAGHCRGEEDRQHVRPRRHRFGYRQCRSMRPWCRRRTWMTPACPEKEANTKRIATRSLGNVAHRGLATAPSRKGLMGLMAKEARHWPLHAHVESIRCSCLFYKHNGHKKKGGINDPVFLW